MKTNKGTEETQHRSTRPAAAIRTGNSHTTTSLTDNRSSSSLQRRLIEGIDSSPQSITQRQLQAQMGSVQRAAAEEEELLQGKFETAQRAAPEEEELLQGKFETAQRAAPEEEELLQGKFAMAQRQPEEEEELQGKFESAPSVNKTGMPDNLKSGIESLSGMDMSDVRVHRNSGKPAQLNALAYAQGNDIHLGAGQEQHLPHEAWHVVQQRQGRVKPTMQMAGEMVNDDVSLEREADVMGGRALQMKGVEEKKELISSAIAQRATEVTQRRRKRGRSSGTFIPNKTSHIHLHIDISKPHLQIGAKRYDLGQNYEKARLDKAFDALEKKKQGEGYQECWDWLVDKLDYRDEITVDQGDLGGNEFMSMSDMWDSRN